MDWWPGVRIPVKPRGTTAFRLSPWTYAAVTRPNSRVWFQKEDSKPRAGNLPFAGATVGIRNLFVKPRSRCQIRWDGSRAVPVFQHVSAGAKRSRFLPARAIRPSAVGLAKSVW
jgi:hypothetical protein